VIRSSETSVLTRSHGFTSQKRAFFIVTAMKTSHHTKDCLLWNQRGKSKKWCISPSVFCMIAIINNDYYIMYFNGYIDLSLCCKNWICIYYLCGYHTSKVLLAN
jgi:hypothetical protein